MDFNQIVANFAYHKAAQYAEKEIAENNEIMGADLAAYCQNELYKYIFPNILRILAYEYNKLQDEGTIDPSLPEEKLYEAFEKTVLSTEYSRAFEKKFFIFPETMGKQIRDLAVYQREIYENFKTDREAMKQTLSEEFDEIREIECSQGDLHNGKSVAFITFANGKRLVYKPRNEDNSLLLETVVNFLAQGGKVKDYRFIRHFSAKDHSWEIIAEPHFCRSVEEMERYYYRAGVLLAAFYFLSSFDMHHENVIADGEYPVIIDCETIARSHVSSEEDTIGDNKGMVDSVLSSAFLPNISEDDPFGVNLSGLFSWTGTAKSAESQMVLENGVLNFKEVQGTVEEEKNIVALEDGTTLGIESAKRKLISGFRDACAYAIDRKTDLVQTIDAFCASHDLEFRQLLRNTQSYGKFVQAGYHPDLLQDEDERDDMFMILSRNFVPGKFGYIRVQHEISELKKGGIPLYYTRPDTPHLYSNGEVVCENYFLESPLASIQKRIERFDSEALDYQVSLIEKSVALTTLEQSFVGTRIMRLPEQAPMTEEYFKKNIKYVVDSLQKSAFKTGQKSSSMLTLGYALNNGRVFMHKNLDSALYENGAFPLVLAYWGEWYHDADALDLAKRFLENDYAEFEGVAAAAKDAKSKKASHQNFSVFSGIGGILYLSYNMYALTGDRYYWDKYLEEAKLILEVFLKKETLEKDDFDYVNGIFGSIYLIGKIYRANPTASETLRESLFAAIERSIRDFDLSEHLHVGFAHGLSGHMIIFTEFYKLMNNEICLDLVERFLQAEDKLIAQGDWDQSHVYTWCNGRSGVLLCRHLLKKAALPSEWINSVVGKYDAWLHDEEMFEIPNLCICHGVFGNLEIMKVLLGEKFDLNAILPYRLFDSFSDLQWIDGLEYEYEGFMSGNTGIAYAMLELLNAAPPILSLELWSINP